MPTVDIPSTTCAAWRRLHRFRQRWESINRRAQWGTPVFEWMSSCLRLSPVMWSSCWCSSGLLKAWSGFLDVHTCSMSSVEHQSCHRIQQRVGAISFIRLLAVVLPVLIIYRGAWSRRRKLCLVVVVRHWGLWASRQASYLDYSVDSAKIEKFYYCVLTFKFVCVLCIIQLLLHFTQVQLNCGPIVSVFSVGPEYLLYCYFASPTIPDCFKFIYLSWSVYSKLIHEQFFK
jgi:hypothetical protein